MDKWQECTTRGITEFRLKYYGNAILMHYQALDHLNMAWADFLRKYRQKVPRAKLAQFHQGLQAMSAEQFVPSGLCH